jgi:hypothetical protein
MAQLNITHKLDVFRKEENMAKVSRTFKTPKGTELKLMDLKGKDYLLAADRILWFREENPKGILKSTMIAHAGEGQDEYCIFSAEVYVDTERGPMMIAQAHKRESRKDFSDFIEKCQTSAYARALALAGYGTQFTGDEMEEGDRLADAPLAVVQKTESTISNGTVPEATVATLTKRSSFRKNVAAVSEDI